MIELTEYTPGFERAHVVNARTGKNPRQILVRDLHPTATTKTGQPRRTGYAIETDATGGAA